MRLVQLKVSNFRCFKDETTVTLDNLVVLIGKNDSGKSSLLDAMNIFFSGVPEQDDLCVHAADQKLTITCAFDDLPKQLVLDEQYPTDLAAEYLLNQGGKLEIAMVFNCTGSGKVKPASVFARANHPTADKYNDLLTLTNAKLKLREKELGVDVTAVHQTINTALRRAMWAHAPDLKRQPVAIELKSEAAERIWDQLKKHLPVFALFKSDREGASEIRTG